MLLHHSLDREIKIRLRQAKNSCVKHCDILKTCQASFHVCVQTYHRVTEDLKGGTSLHLISNQTDKNVAV